MQRIVIISDIYFWMDSAINQIKSTAFNLTKYLHNQHLGVAPIVKFETLIQNIYKALQELHICN